MKPSKVIFLLAALVGLTIVGVAAEAKSQLAFSQVSQDNNTPLPIAQNLDVVRHWGGLLNGMVVEGAYGYLSVGSELKIFNLADPKNPTLVGSLFLGNTFDRAYLNGRYLYVSSDGLTIIDVLNPAAPVWVSSLDSVGTIYNIVVSGDYAYLATANGLAIVDVSDAQEPQFVSHVLDQPLYNVLLKDEYIYLNDEDEIFVLNVSNLAHPIEVYSGQYAGGEYETISDMILVDDYLYVLGFFMAFNPAMMNPTALDEVADSYADILILDITNPAAPNKVATHNYGDYGGYEIALEGDHLFILNTYSDDVIILNVANPEMPQWVTTYDNSWLLYSFQVSNGYVYLIQAQKNIVVLDATTPTNPVDVNLYPVTNGSASGQVVADDYLYLNVGWEVFEFSHQLRTYDLSDPLAPSLLSTYNILHDGLGWTWGVAAQDNFAYVIYWKCVGHACQAYHPYLEVVDVSNPLTPTLVAERYLYSPNNYGSYNIKVYGHYAFFVGSEASIFDITDPTQPLLVQYLPNEWLNVNPVNMTASGNYLYVAANNSEGGRVEIVDFTDPAAPIPIGSYQTIHPLSSVNIVAGYLYVIEDGSAGRLHVLDISNPAAPTEVNTYYHPWYLGTTLNGSLLVEGNYAYVGHNVLDISDPANPTLIGFHPVPGEWAVKGDYIYVIERAGGWYVLKQTPVMVPLTPGVSASLTYTHYQHFPTHFNFPAGSVTEPITITVNPSTAEDIAGYSFARHTFGLSAVQGETTLPDFIFATPITITLRYSHDDVRLVSNESELALWVWTENGWQDATETCHVPAPYVRDIVNNVLTLTICQTGRFALFGPTHQRYFPLIDWR